MAHAYIDAVARTGADAVKFQTHIAAAESSPQEPWRVRFSPQDETRYDYWKRMEFTPGQWAGLKTHAEERGLKFLSSPFSVEAVDLLGRMGIAAWKVASGEVNNAPLFDRMCRYPAPILLSTGMSSWQEIQSAVERIRARSLPLTLMQCTTAYPCPPEKIGLNLLPVMRQRFGCAVGLSDHSGTIFPGLAAAAIGAEAVEVHVVLSREAFGPDVPASLTTSELRQLVEGVRFVGCMLRNPVDKDAAARDLAPLRNLFMKSIAARQDLSAGIMLSESHLALRKPGTGIPADRFDEVVGRVLRRSVAAGEFLRESDFAEATPASAA